MGIRVEFNSRFVSSDSIIGKDNLLTLDVCVISCSSAFPDNNLPVLFGEIQIG
jgi:hypothetical protein